MESEFLPAVYQCVHCGILGYSNEDFEKCPKGKMHEFFKINEENDTNFSDYKVNFQITTGQKRSIIIQNQNDGFNLLKKNKTNDSSFTHKINFSSSANFREKESNVSSLLKFYDFLSDNTDHFSEIIIKLLEGSDVLKFEKSLTRISENLQEAERTFFKDNNYTIDETTIKMTSYSKYLLFFTNTLKTKLNKIINQMKSQNLSLQDTQVSGFLKVIIMFCGKTQINQTPMYYRLKLYEESSPNLAVYTIFTHYLIYLLLRLEDYYEFNILHEGLTKFLKEINVEDYNEENLIVDFSLFPNFLDKLLRFCTSEIFQPFFEEILDYCGKMKVQTEFYKQNNTLEKLKNNLLTQLLENFDDDHVIKLNSEILKETEAETTYNQRVFINSRFFNLNQIKLEAVLLILLSHEICHLVRICLINDGDFFIGDTPGKFSIFTELQNQKNLPSPAEIGYYCEEKFILFESVKTLKLMNIDLETANFINEEKNWKVDKFRTQFILNNPSSKIFSSTPRKEKRTGNVGEKHFSFGKFQKLVRDLNLNPHFAPPEFLIKSKQESRK